MTEILVELSRNIKGLDAAIITICLLFPIIIKMTKIKEQQEAITAFICITVLGVSLIIARVVIT